MVDNPIIDNYLLKTSLTVSLITWINYRDSSLIFFDGHVIAVIIFNADTYLYDVILTGHQNLLHTFYTFEEGKKLVLSEIDARQKAIDLPKQQWLSEHKEQQ